MKLIPWFLVDIIGGAARLVGYDTTVCADSGAKGAKSLSFTRHEKGAPWPKKLKPVEKALDEKKEPLPVAMGNAILYDIDGNVIVFATGVASVSITFGR